MAEQVVAEYKLDVNDAVKNLDRLQSELKDTESAAIKASKAANDGFIKGSDGAKRFQRELDKQPKTLAELELKLQRLRELLRDDTEIGTKGFKRVSEEIKKTEQAIKGANGKLNEMGKKGNGMMSIFKKLGRVLAAAFAVDKIINYGKEAVKLAAQSEGVERAFKRIGSPQILKDLREATRGSVSDLQLMQNAVKASNFKIPLESLASLFKFAQARARETGESVDYLVDSIILGIGRKSPLILDNLGISAVELRTRLKGVGVEAANVGDIAKIIGDIATEELEKMGDQADTTADKFAQMQTSWINFKTEFGQFIISTGVIDKIKKVVDAYQNALKVAQGETLKTIEINEGAEESIASFGENAKRFIEKIIKPLEDGKENTLALTRANQELANSQNKLNSLINKRANDERELLLLEKQLEETNPFNKLVRIELKNLINSTKEKIALDNIQVKQLEAVINTYKTYKATITETDDETKPYIRSLNQLNKELKDLDEQLKDAKVGSSKFWNILDKVEKKTVELNEAIAMTKLAEALKVDEEDMPDVSGAVIGYSEEVQRETDIADKIWQAHFDGLMMQTDEFNKKREKDIESEAEFQKMQRQMNQEFYNATLKSWQTLTYAITELSRAQYEEQQRGLEDLLDRGIITQEEYDRRRASLAREQFKKDKEAKLIQASINTALGVTNAIATAPNIILGLILAAAAAAAGAAEIAVISSQPVPRFKEGGLVANHGLLKGKTHSQGGILIEAEKDEYFMPTAPTLRNYGLLEAMRKGAEDQYIMNNYVPKLIDKSLFKGFADLGKSAQLNGIGTTFKDHNLIAAIDRDRQSTTKVLGLIYQELKSKKRNDRYA